MILDRSIISHHLATQRLSASDKAECFELLQTSEGIFAVTKATISCDHVTILLEQSWNLKKYCEIFKFQSIVEIGPRHDVGNDSNRILGMMQCWNNCVKGILQYLGTEAHVPRSSSNIAGSLVLLRTLQLFSATFQEIKRLKSYSQRRVSFS